MADRLAPGTYDPNPPPVQSSSGSSSATSNDDLAKAFSQAVSSMAVGVIQNNKPQIHDSNDD